MQLTASEDIEAPIERVFAELSDFEAIERQALRRGIEITREEGGEGIQEGMRWRAGFRFRGKPREAQITLKSYTAPEEMVFGSVAGGLETETRIEVVSLSRSRTRISLITELQPKTLSARLLVQSLKLAKGGIDKRFRRKMAGYAKDLEVKLKNAA